jgi:hypothetical protein
MGTNAIESKARRAAARVGLVARKSRTMNPAINQGEFMVVDPETKGPVTGFNYDLSAEEVIEFCKD